MAALECVPVTIRRLLRARSGLAVLRYHECDRAGETFTVNTAAGASGKVQLSAVAFDKVPEPASITLMGAGLGGVAFLRRRGKRAG
jgi:PEP-CTERM motif